MLCKALLAVAAVWVGAVWSAGGGGLEEARGSLLLPRDYGVKLCGREFIRAVIFTCGGSRWRRDERPDEEPFHWRSPSHAFPQDYPRPWQGEVAALQDGRSPLHIPLSFSSSSSSDLLALSRLLGEQMQSAQRLPRLSSTELKAGRASAVRTRLSRKGRNLSMGMAGMCCDRGCTKNDIGRLC